VAAAGGPLAVRHLYATFEVSIDGRTRPSTRLPSLPRRHHRAASRTPNGILAAEQDPGGSGSAAFDGERLERGAQALASVGFVGENEG
jgi:hypothetical protein